MVLNLYADLHFLENDKHFLIIWWPFPIFCYLTLKKAYTLSSGAHTPHIDLWKLIMWQPSTLCQLCVADDGGAEGTFLTF